MFIDLSRKQAFKVAWALARMASGSSKVRLELGKGETVVLSGAGLIKRGEA